MVTMRRLLGGLPVSLLTTTTTAILLVILQPGNGTGSEVGPPMRAWINVTNRTHFPLKTTTNASPNEVVQQSAYLGSGDSKMLVKHSPSPHHGSGELSRNGQQEVTLTGRSYSGYGSSGGGGGSYGGYNSGGGMMYYSNFDTALTTLAFLSFGVFLLNMLFSFLDFGTPLGPITRTHDDDGGKDGKSKRSTSPTLSPGALLALDAIQKTLMDDEEALAVTAMGQPECAFRVLCDVKNYQPLRKRRNDDTFISMLTE